MDLATLHGEPRHAVPLDDELRSIVAGAIQRAVKERVAVAYSGVKLPGEEPEPTYGYLTPESSQRARSLAVWAALRAWGRAGYREMVERHLDLAQHLRGRHPDPLRRVARALGARGGLRGAHADRRQA